MENMGIENFYKGKTVLVTGATGLVGYNLTKELLSLGSNVIALSRHKFKSEVCFESYNQNPNFTCVNMDIQDSITDLNKKIDYIFHAAGNIALDLIENYPMDVITPNIMGAIRCLEYLKYQEEKHNKKGKIIFLSSEAVYGKAEFTRTVLETDTQFADIIGSVRSPYSESKRMTEIIVNSWNKQYGIDGVNARLSWVYGDAPFKAKQSLFDFIETAISGEDILINNPDTPKRDNISMVDAINGLLYVAAYGKSGESYNISSNGDKGNFIAADELAELIIKIINDKYDYKKKIKVIHKKKKIKRSPGNSLDNNKLKSLGWECKTDIQTGLEQLIEGFIKNVYRKN